MVTNPVTQVPATPIGAGSVGEVALALGIVLVAILAVAWLMRRLHGGSIGGAGPMRVLSVMSVGPRERLLLVDVAGQQLLLGVTATQISNLHAFAEPVVNPGESAAGDFAQRLRQALGRGQPG
jgi:flagellar protein FliO/FliZ